jgi:hypothetical protein
MGIPPDARFFARSSDALTVTLCGHFAQAIYLNRPIVDDVAGDSWQALPGGVLLGGAGRHHHGKVVQVDPIKPTLKAPGSKALEV